MDLASVRCNWPPREKCCAHNDARQVGMTRSTTKSWEPAVHLHLRYSCQSVCLFSVCAAGSLTSPKGVEQRQPNTASRKDQVASRIVGRSRSLLQGYPTGPFLSLADMFARPRPVPITGQLSPICARKAYGMPCSVLLSFVSLIGGDASSCITAE